MKHPSYWVQRAWGRMVDIELMGNGYVDRLHLLYRTLAGQIESDMLHLFRRYREQGALTEEEAAALLREPVDRAGWELLRRQIGAVQDEARRRQLMAEMNASSVRARLDRQQAMLLDLRARCAQLAQQELPLHTEVYQRTADEAYLRTVFDAQQEAADRVGADPQTGELPGEAAPVEDPQPAPSLPKPIPAPHARPSLPQPVTASPEPEPLPRSPLPQPAALPRDAMDDLLAERWSGKTYSERIWANTDAMAEHLADIVSTNMATGRSWRRCLDEMQAYAASPTKGALYAAERLLRTEMNYMANQMALRGMLDMGVKHYRYIATLDGKTSEICQKHDGLRDPATGKLYEISKARAGENVPPLHPNCRSTIAAVVDGAAVDAMMRAGRDPVTGKSVMVPASMTYPEWKDSLLRRSDLSAGVKERLLGGKKKRILFDAGVLEASDVDTPWQTLEKRGMIVPSNAVLQHSTAGEFKAPTKEYPLGRMTGGGHGESNFQELAKRSIAPEITRTYTNGVRQGNVPGHQDKTKRGGEGQFWFPQSWTDEDIHIAGAYVANHGSSAPVSWGSAKEADWHGVRVRVAFDDTGKPMTICPSYDQEEN